MNTAMEEWELGSDDIYGALAALDLGAGLMRVAVSADHIRWTAVDDVAALDAALDDAECDVERTP